MEISFSRCSGVLFIGSMELWFSACPGVRAGALDGVVCMTIPQLGFGPGCRRSWCGFDRSNSLCLAVFLSLGGLVSLQFRCVLLYFFYDGGLCAYGLLMIVILNMTLRVMNYVMRCRLSSLNEDDLQPRPYPAWTRIPHFRTPARGGPESASRGNPIPWKDSLIVAY